MGKQKVLFVCVHNSGRSQMAEAFFNQLADGKATAISAGTKPASQINPAVILVMREIGIEMSSHKPKKVTPEMMESAGRIITMGCGVEDTCPARIIPMEDWGIEDPTGKPLYKVREIRDVIRVKVKTLIEEIKPGV